MGLQLFEVVRWGNESDDPVTGGGNGPDTCFLVRASSRDEAVALVDAVLARMPSDYVEPWAHLVHLIGTEASIEDDPRILRGPYIEHAYGHGWQTWSRNEPGDPWKGG